MRRGFLVALPLFFAAPAWAGFNAYYEGTVVDQGKTVPAKAQFSVEKGRVAAIMKGAKSYRMLFLEKEQDLRLVSDDDKTYVDLDKKALESMHGDVSAELAKMQSQMAKLSPEQRAMAEQMMGQAMSSAAVQPEDVYVQSQEHQTIRGHDCTRVDVMQGTTKRAEYWGSTDDEFVMTKEERTTILAMQSYLRNYLLQMRTDGEDGTSMRAFRWDTRTDGFPLITRCFRGDQATLDLHLIASDKKDLAEDLFKAPSGYKKRDLAADTHAMAHGRHKKGE
jgi:Domain of unknown function (DUF4412)